MCLCTGQVTAPVTASWPVLCCAARRPPGFALGVARMLAERRRVRQRYWCRWGRVVSTSLMGKLKDDRSRPV